MPSLGPVQFDLEIAKAEQTRAPGEPLSGSVFRAAVHVSVNWNLARTDLAADEPVAFSALRWLDAGHGPLPVYEVSYTGTKKIGTVRFDVVSGYYRVAQDDAASGRFRWLITPYLKLMRTFTPLEGVPATTEVQHQQATAEGAWQPMPA